jgi:hypothetical protein
MAKQRKEAELTPILVRSLQAAGVGGLHKIADSPWDPTGRTMKFQRRKPCDLVAVLPGGRALRVEAKQMPILDSGQVPGFTVKRLADHQHEHLAEVAQIGGCAVVALFVWRARGEGNKGEKRLYWLEYGRLLDLWEKHSHAIPPAIMSRLQPVPLAQGGKSGRKFLGWDLTAEVCAASIARSNVVHHSRSLSLADVRAHFAT